MRLAGTVVHPWSAGGGNPKLEPWRAKELDVGYEWYGGKASYFALHGFYMWLDNYIYNQALAADFTGLTPPPAISCLKFRRMSSISPIGELDAPANGQGGWVRGVEVSGAIEFGRVRVKSWTASARPAASRTPTTSSSRLRAALSAAFSPASRNGFTT